MAMESYGKWQITVIGRDAAFEQRFQISGTLSGDGVYDGVPGNAVLADGDGFWMLDFQWNDNAGSGWQQSDARMVGIEATLQRGLIKFIGIDDNLPEFRDGDYNDLVVECLYLDPLSTNSTLQSPPDFSYTPIGPD